LTLARGPAAKWVELDRNAVQVDSDVEAIAKGATGWSRPEDIEIVFNARTPRGRADVMYVTSTSEALVLRVELRGSEAFVSNCVKERINVRGSTIPTIWRSTAPGVCQSLGLLGRADGASLRPVAESHVGQRAARGRRAS
jgi:hypothetical protein